MAAEIQSFGWTEPNPASSGTRPEAGEPLNSTTRASPKLQAQIHFFDALLFSAFPLPFSLTQIALPQLCEKVKDCETTNGHVGLIARTLMKDARRGLAR